MSDAGANRPKPWRASIVGGLLVVVAAAVWLGFTGSSIDRQRNDAVARAVQLDVQLDGIRGYARTIRKANDEIHASADGLGRVEAALADVAAGASHPVQALDGDSAAGIKAMTDATNDFRRASRAMLEAYSGLGMYEGDVRGARQLAVGVVSMLEDGEWSYGQGYQGLHAAAISGRLSASGADAMRSRFADGDRAVTRAKLGLDNFNDAVSDLWRSALNRRNQPLDDARRFGKPFPLSLFDRAQLPPDRNDAPM